MVENCRVMSKICREWYLGRIGNGYKERSCLIKGSLHNREKRRTLSFRVKRSGIEESTHEGTV